MRRIKAIMLTLLFTNIVFACALETAPDLSGPWVEIARERTTCPQTHTFTVEPTNAAAFFRLRLLDNGLVPTPDRPYALRIGSGVALSCPNVYNCTDDPMTRYKWFRDGLFIGESRRGDFTDYPPAGSHSYQAIAVDGVLESWPSAQVIP